MITAMITKLRVTETINTKPISIRKRSLLNNFIRSLISITPAITARKLINIKHSYPYLYIQHAKPIYTSIITATNKT